MESLKKVKIEELDDDCDSITELGQIAILGSSRASLKIITQSTASDLNVLKNKKEEFISLSNKLLEVKKDDVKSIDYELTLFQKLLKPMLPYIGIFIGILSAFSFCLSQVQLKRSKWFSATDHSVIRYLTALVIMIIFLKYKEMSVFGPKKQMKLLLARGFIGKKIKFATYI